MRPARGLGCSGPPQSEQAPQILTGLTVDTCIAMRALADVLGEDVPSVRVVNHLAFGIITAGVWKTRTWEWRGREGGQGIRKEPGIETGSSRCPRGPSTQTRLPARLPLPSLPSLPSA